MITDADIITALGGDLTPWSLQCHAASIRIVRSGILGDARVARGTCVGVGGQHSWVVVGGDCYDVDAPIWDATLWSYDEHVDGVWRGTMRDGRHRPFGQGSIWDWGRPDYPTEEPIELTPSRPLSGRARDFLGMLGPLDRRGWAVLAHAPVEEWPAGEIIRAMYETEAVGALIPIDIVGMVTDVNPSGLYLMEKP